MSSPIRLPSTKQWWKARRRRRFEGPPAGPGPGLGPILETTLERGNDRRLQTSTEFWTSPTSCGSIGQDSYLDKTLEFKNGLPPYDPEKSNLPPLPTTPVDGEALRERYGLSKAAFHHRKTFLPGIPSIRQGKRVFFPPSSVYLLDATHWLKEQGYTLSEVKEALDEFDTGQLSDTVDETPIEVGEPVPTRLAATESTLAVSPQAAQLSRDLGLLIVKAVEAVTPKQYDPLRNHRLLQEAAENKFVITTKMAAECAGVSASTVRRWGDTQEVHGFEFRRVAGRLKWQVRRLPDEEVGAA